MISTKGRYALRVMLELARRNTTEYVPLKEIAEKEQISKKYLEIIVKELVGAKLLKGASGKGGGYMLSKKPEEYSVGEILESTEGSLSIVACLSKDAEECPRAAACATLPMWTEFNNMVYDYFYSKKLSDLVSEDEETSK